MAFCETVAVSTPVLNALVPEDVSAAEDSAALLETRGELEEAHGKSGER